MSSDDRRRLTTGNAIVTDNTSHQPDIMMCDPSSYNQTVSRVEAKPRAFSFLLTSLLGVERIRCHSRYASELRRSL